MKKILLATTALVASAGVASAEITLSGFAEMGIYDNGNDDTQFFTDIDVTFTMSGEADNGLTFGANIDLDESDGCGASGASGAFSPSTQGGEAIFVSYGGATLTMGDTDGAFDKILPEMALAGGSLADDETAHAGFNTGDGNNLGADGLDKFGDGQIARFDYAYNAFTFSLSAEQVANGAQVAGAGETIWGLGVGYSGTVGPVDLTVGLAYQDWADVGNVTGIAATGAFSSGFSAGLTYSVFNFDTSGIDDITHVGLGFGYEMNAIAVGVNWGKYEQGSWEQSGWGLAGSYDLGGGLSARMGYGKSEFNNGTDMDTWSLGLRMNF